MLHVSLAFRVTVRYPDFAYSGAPSPGLALNQRPHSEPRRSREVMLSNQLNTITSITGSHGPVRGHTRRSVSGRAGSAAFGRTFSGRVYPETTHVVGSLCSLGPYAKPSVFTRLGRNRTGWQAPKNRSCRVDVTERRGMNTLHRAHGVVCLVPSI